MKNYKNILVVRTDRIGDVVLTTPSLKALRKKFPDAKISILVSPLTKDLVDGNPNIDEIIVDDREKTNKGFFGYLRLIGMMREKKFDLAIIFHTKKRTNLLCFLSRIPDRIGYKNNKLGFLLTKQINDIRHLGKIHESECCLNVLKSLEIDSDDLDFFLPVKQESELWVEQFFKQNSILDEDMIIAVHVGASDPSKRWPEEYFSVLIDQLSEKYKAKIISIGASDIRPISRRISSNVKERIIDLTGIITLSQLISILKRCALLVSNDSGPVHIASAVNVPVISIFTRNHPGINPERWRPLSNKSKVISVAADSFPKDSDIHKNPFLKSGKVDFEYLKTIKPSQILESIDSIFNV